MSWMVTHHHEDGHPPSEIYQKEFYYRLEIWHLDLTHKIKTRLSAIDDQPPSPEWSTTIQKKVFHNSKYTWRNCTTELKFTNKTKIKIRWSALDSQPQFLGWLPTIPLSKIYQKKLCYRLEIWHLDFTQKIKTRWTTMDAYSLSQGWSPTVQNLPIGIVLQTWNLALGLNSQN